MRAAIAPALTAFMMALQVGAGPSSAAGKIRGIPYRDTVEDNPDPGTALVTRINHYEKQP